MKKFMGYLIALNIIPIIFIIITASENFFTNSNYSITLSLIAGYIVTITGALIFLLLRTTLKLLDII